MVAIVTACLLISLSYLVTFDNFLIMFQFDIFITNA